MDDLVRWLGEQLDEDERIARAAAGLQADPENGWGISDRAITPHIGVVHEDEARAHIARHNPARVLREIDAKRQIVAAYLPPGADPHPGLPCVNYEDQDPQYYSEYDSCARHLEADERLIRHDYVLRLLALPYADRPGYREKWRP